ncbi:MAG: DUF4097 family beta strand repeat protein [Clostridia bacterium]|nr:DUF4097 family beta strand repeat protein [Clostridia bacterium]
MKKGLIITAVILTVAGLILIISSWFFNGPDFSVSENAKTETNAYTITDRFENIDISTLEADITLIPSENRECRIVCEERAYTKHNVSTENGTLKIEVEDTRKWYDYIMLFSFNSQSVTVYLPSDRYEELDISCVTGRVSVSEKFTFENASIESSTGSVLFKASADGDVKIKTITGGIHIDGINAKNIGLSVSSGSVTAEKINCDGDITVSVSTGRTTLDGVNCKSLFSSGSTGRITLKDTVATESFRIERNTGDIYFQNSDAGEIYAKTSTGDVTGTLNSEKVFIAKTSTGKIMLPDSVSGGRCEITTATGDINISIKE